MSFAAPIANKLRPVAVAIVAVAVAVAVAGFASGCGIAPTDPFPSFGAACVVEEARCGIEHVCRGGADPTRGICVPVGSFGAVCDELEPVTHPPGREGTDDLETTELVIDEVTDLAFLDDVRAFAGQVRIAPPGGDLVGTLDIGNACAFRDVQRVGNGLGLGKSNVTDFNGLQSMTSVDGLLAIYSNPDLESLAGLENVAHLSLREVELDDGDTANFELAIVDNDQLPDDVVDAFIDALELRIGRPIDGVLKCGNRGAPCNLQDVGKANAITRGLSL